MSVEGMDKPYLDALARIGSALERIARVMEASKYGVTADEVTHLKAMLREEHSEEP